MATNNQHRITKDVSARKNPDKATMQQTFELAALKASHEAYLNSITSGYEDKIDSLVSEHNAEIEGLQSQLAAGDKAIRAKQKAITTAAVTKAQEEMTTVFRNLKAEKEELKSENEKLQAAYKDSLSKNKEAANTAQKERDVLQLNINRLNFVHNRDIAELQRKVNAHPNSWIKISFHLKAGGRGRHYWKKVGSTLREAEEGLRKDIKIENETTLIFTRGGSIPLEKSKTLEQLGIGEATPIYYSKR
ncbi:hypothetical protein LTR37_017570 [Vermiconidia calcicola]|uniref:Uncharacterized protein n=1 Tax=Vermiconidia calcicola TaxID=1690605 RepID=A0ACC3MKT8_9PEZI|nr:hypothetical protein LTR37_017570 [Vermiconidia calcicola]